MIRGLHKAHELRVNLCEDNMFQDYLSRRAYNFGITSVCDNISLRITSYMDDMNTLKNYDNFKRKYVCNNNTITYSKCIKFVVIAFHKDNYKLTELLRKRSSVCQERGISSPSQQQQLTQRGAASPKSNKQGFKSCYACSDKINTRSQIAKPHIFMTNPQTKTPYTLWGGFVWGMEFCVSRGCTRMAISNPVLLKKCHQYIHLVSQSL